VGWRRGKGGWVDLHVYGGVCERGLATIGCIEYLNASASLAVDLYRLNSPAFSRQMAFLWRWQRSSAPTFASAWDMNREALNPRPLLIVQEHRMVMLPTRQFTKPNQNLDRVRLERVRRRKRGNRLRTAVEVCFLPKTGEFSGQQQIRV